MAKYRMDFTETDRNKMLTYSPDLNAIENTFKNADDDAKELQVASFALTPQATCERWKACLLGLADRKGTGKNHILAVTDGFANRLRDVLKRKGAATRW